MSLRALCVALLICAFTSVREQISLSSGQFTVESGYYTVTINFEGESLTLIEPNRTSVYRKIAENTFSFVHPETKVDYRIDVIDKVTIHAYKPQTPDNRTILRLNTAGLSAEYTFYLAMAQRYKTMMLTDKKDAQLWAFCSAAAFARSTMDGESFREYARKIVASVRPIVTDQGKCPCEDAIPAEIWTAVK
jgi:hypothetical protein